MSAREFLDTITNLCIAARKDDGITLTDLEVKEESRSVRMAP